jgi:hypothetical protein
MLIGTPPCEWTVGVRAMGALASFGNCLGTGLIEGVLVKKGGEHLDELPGYRAKLVRYCGE